MSIPALVLVCAAAYFESWPAAIFICLCSVIAAQITQPSKGSNDGK